jgi:NADH-quinone oxidoreductase subunit G
MEMLLINHPLDCPICDQGGECDLQDQAVGYGFDRSRFDENKRAVKDKELGPLIKTVMTRCINCTRCVRFAEEIAGTPVLGQFHRGEEAEIGTFIQELVQTELSGNLIDICPVGALTSKPYAFNARPWELKKTESIDVHDALGSNIRVDTRGNEIMRILPRLNEDVNEEWISDRTRFSYDGLKYGRLDRPYIRDEKSGKLKEASWQEALQLIATKLRGLHSHSIAALAGDMADIESMTALRDIMECLGAPNLDCRTDGSQIDPAVRSGYVFNSGISGIDQADAILLIGANPRHEASVLNARIRRAGAERRVKVGVIGEAADLTYKYDHIGNSPLDIESLMGSKTGFAKIMRDAKNPMIIVGAGAFTREDGAAVHNLCFKLAENLGVIREGWNGFNVLQNAASRVGGLDIGFSPQKNGKGFNDILAGTKDGTIKALYLLGADEFDAKSTIGWQCFVIYQGHHGDKGAARADVILPGAAYTEKDATYINTEGRAQQTRRAAFPPGEAKEDWKIMRALSEYLVAPLPYNDLADLRQRIISQWPHIGQIDILHANPWQAFGQEGDLENEPFETLISEYYLTNTIARASKTMQACQNEFTHAKTAKEAA